MCSNTRKIFLWIEGSDFDPKQSAKIWQKKVFWIFYEHLTYCFENHEIQQWMKTVRKTTFLRTKVCSQIVCFRSIKRKSYRLRSACKNFRQNWQKVLFSNCPKGQHSDLCAEIYFISPALLNDAILTRNVIRFDDKDYRGQSPTVQCPQRLGQGPPVVT